MYILCFDVSPFNDDTNNDNTFADHKYIDMKQTLSNEQQLKMLFYYIDLNLFY